MDMPKIVDYSYVQTSSDKNFDIAAKELQKLISSVMAMGYVPCGGVAYQCILVNGLLLHILVQAIIKYETGGRDYDHA